MHSAQVALVHVNFDMVRNLDAEFLMQGTFGIRYEPPAKITVLSRSLSNVAMHVLS